MPKTKWEGYERFCPFARALDVVGERWTLVIVHALLAGPARYSELKGDLPGIGTNVLSDRLRKLEAGGLVERVLGDVGEGTRYALTERGRGLDVAMAELRRWGVDELLADPDPIRTYDLSYALPEGLELDDTFEWRIDDRVLFLSMEGQQLALEPEPRSKPALVLETSADFMRRWAAGEATWDEGRAQGAVTVRGSKAAWQRMLLATNYPGRPAGLADELLARQTSAR